MRTCEAPETPLPPAPVSVKAWLATLARTGGPRCGKPAAFVGPFGAYCDECGPDYARRYLDPATTINVLAGGPPRGSEGLTVADVLARWRIQ